MNAAPALVAFSVATVAWAIGGTLSGLLLKVAPVSLASLMAASFLCPQRLQGESFAEARVRVRRSLRVDPLTWVALGLFVLLLIPLANVGLCWQCDAAQIAAGADPAPPVAWLPSCLNRREHLGVVVCFLLALSVLPAVRHGLTAEGRRRFLDLLVWNGVALAVLGLVQRIMRAPGPLWLSCDIALRPDEFFSTFGYPNFGAAYFTVMQCVAVFALDDVRREVAALNPSAVAERMIDRSQYRRRVAIELWKDNKLFGCGGWGFMHLCTTKMTAEELARQEMRGGAFVHNDYLQFLCEHGAVGFGLMAVLLVALLRPLWGRWRRSPATLFVAAGVFAVLAQALWDCPLRCPAVLMALVGLLAAVWTPGDKVV